MKDLLRFELRYQASQRVFPLAVLTFFVFGLMLAGSHFGPANVTLLAPWLLAEVSGILALLAVFPAAIFTSQALLRDEEHRMTDLILATPMKRGTYLGSRYASALLASFAVFACGPLGYLAGALLLPQPAERLGGLTPGGLLLALLLIGLPAIAFVTAVLFALAAATRSSLATAAGSLLVYFLYFAASAVTGSPLMASSRAGDGSLLALAAWIDPFGLSSFFSYTVFWTAAEKSALLPFGGVLLANRLGTLALALLLLAATHRFFRTESRLRRSAGADRRPAPKGGRPRLGPATVWLSKAWLELRFLAAGWPLRVAFVLWLALAATEIWGNLFSGEYGSAVLPATGALLDRVDEPFLLFGLVLLVYFGSELVWLENSYKIEPVLAATPARSGAFATAKFAALAALALGLGLATVALGITLQLLRGYHCFEPQAYLAFLLTSCLPLLVFAAGSLLLHRLAPNRHLGLFASLLLALGVVMAGGLGLEHNLLRFAGSPGLAYSRLAGFGGTLLPAAAFLLYRSLFGLFLLVLAATFWRRGQKPDFRAARPQLAAASLLFLGCGAAILYQTNGLHRYETAADRLAWREAYERKYRALEDEPQPRPRFLDAKVELYPAERRARVAGRYRFDNPNPSGLSELSFTAAPETVSLSSARAAAITRDDRFSVFTLKLREPLAPGETFELDFAVELHSFGIENDGPDPALVENGSYLTLWRLLPRAGYVRQLEIRDPRERRKRGLPERPPLAEGEAEETRQIAFALEASTDAGQIAVGPGRLRSRETADGRSISRYDSAGREVADSLAIASARYEIAEAEAAGARIEVYHDGYQPETAAEIASIAAVSLDQLAALFRHAYPWDSLRLAEIPAFWRFGGFATPAAIFLVENRSFELDLRSPASRDLLVRRVAHEVAHQWWGHGVSPRSGKGSVVLVESLAKYSELAAVARLRGKEAQRRLLELELERYLEERADAVGGEVPLAETGDEAYLFYRKGALVTHALEAALGEEAFRDALATLLEEARQGREPGIAELLAALEAHAAEPAAKARVDELMRRIVLWDFELVGAAEKEGRLQLEIAAARWRAEGDGRETPETFAEEVPIALEYEDGEELRRVRLVPGTNRIELAAPRRPLAVQIDPDLLYIDKTRWNNRRELG